MQNRPSGFGNPWLQLALSVACVLVSEFLLKRGATEVADTDSAWSWTGVNGLASPLVWWAILLIIASFVSWLYVLRYVPINHRFSSVACGRYPRSARLLDFSRRIDFATALVRDRVGRYWTGVSRETDCTI